MIAAVYARKSSEQNLPDAEKSVSRQVESLKSRPSHHASIVPLG